MKILIFCLPGIGDALMTTPMIAALKRDQPQNTIDVATMFESVSYLFKNNPQVQRTLYLPLYKQNPFKGLIEILKLRKEKYDVSILAFPAYRREYHFVQWIVGAKRRLAHTYKRGYISELHFLNTDSTLAMKQTHNVINNMNLLHLLDINWEDRSKEKSLRYELILDENDIVFGRKYIKEAGWKNADVVGIHPGSINSKAGVLKRWPIERFAKVAKYLINEKKKKILIFLGPFEMELGEKLYKLLADAKNTRLVGNLQFSQSLGILSHVKLLLTNDNGFAHLANALRVPTITLFGPTSMASCAPYSSEIAINIRKATFTPWFRTDVKVTNPPRGVKSGMDAIEVPDVLESIEAIL